MIKVNFYEELFRKNLKEKKCNKDELKNVLYKISKEYDEKGNDLIIKPEENFYEVFFYNAEEGNITLELNSAARSRIETDFEKLEFDIKRFDETLKQYQVKTEDSKYCLIRKIDFDDNYLVIDVYVEM